MATRRTKIFWALCAAFFAFMLTVVTISGVTYYRQVSDSRRIPIFTVNTPGSVYNAQALQAQQQLLGIGFTFSGFDPDKGLKLEVGFDPRNQLNNSYGEPSSFVCVAYQSTDLQFKKSEEMNSESLTLPFQGDANWFPFDVWYGSVTFNAHYGADNETCNNPLALVPAVLGTTSGFTLSVVVTPGYNDDNSPDYSQVTVNFTARRSQVHKGFSVLMFTIQWGLSLMLTYICCWTWKGGKRVELGIVAMTAALLYALPRVREAQPGIPKMGIIQDLVGYCWQILMIACCLISLMVNFIIRKERKNALHEARKNKEDGSTLLVAMEAQEPDTEPSTTFA